MKLKKGSLEAKKFMAKIRAKKGASKKVSEIKKPSVKKTHTDIKSHNYKISISGANNYINKEIQLINDIKKGIEIIIKEIKNTDKLIKEQKNVLIKKSLLNKKSYLKKELQIGKSLLKKLI
jgi:hypothetical protein